MVVVSEPRAASSAERLTEELVLLDYEVERDHDLGASLKRLRERDVVAVVVLSGDGHGRYYVRRSREVLVETQLDDPEHPETLPVKIAEGVRSTLHAEAERAFVPHVSPSFELSLGPVLGAATYADPHAGFEAMGLWRLNGRIYLGPRAKATLRADYGEPKSELGASNVVLALTGCAPFPVSPVVTLGLCASLGARAILLSGLTGPQKGESAGAIVGPLVGGALNASFELSQHFALRTALNLDVGFGAHTGPGELPKRSTDLLAAHSASSYFGLDFGLGFYFVYLMR